MSKGRSIETHTEELLAPIAQAGGVEIYDVEYVKEGSDWYLRAYIDKPDGVNIQDCENVSRLLSERIDQEDFIEDSYILEVSSPGLGRALKKDKHLEKSLGEEVEIRLYRPKDGSKEFTGILSGFDDSTITIEIQDMGTIKSNGSGPAGDEVSEGKKLEFTRSEIALIRLTFDF